MSNDVVKRSMVGASPVHTGRFTYGVNNVTLYEWGEAAALKVGAFCSFAKNITVLLGGNHRVDWITTYPFGSAFPRELTDVPVPGHPTTAGDVVIGNDVWIGQGVTIMSGVTIGDGAVLATNATVVKDVAPYEIVGGNPARHIKMRFDEETVTLLRKLSWWDLPLDEIRALIPKLCSESSPALLAELIDQYRS